MTALSKEINKLVEDSPTKVFDKLDKLKAELAESKKIETEVKKLQEIIPKSVLDMEDEDDDVSEEVKQALAELNRKMNKDTTVESQKSGAIKRPEIAKQQTPLKASRKADSGTDWNFNFVLQNLQTFVVSQNQVSNLMMLAIPL